jgi:hypothetical protein
MTNDHPICRSCGYHLPATWEHHIDCRRSEHDTSVAIAQGILGGTIIERKAQ